MLKLVTLSGMMGLLLTASNIDLPQKEVCEGFVPENELSIPVSELSALSGTTEDEFHEVLDRIEDVFKPIVASQGARLQVNRKWSDATVNASAMQMGSTFVINMYGGLARHSAVTPDGFALVACHEMGHHLGGYPKVDSWFSTWASNEGQADYFATLKCMHKIFEASENLEWLEENEDEVDPVAVTTCGEQFTTEEEQALCVRSSMAAMSVSMLFMELRKQSEPPEFDTPDPKQVSRTDDRHPDTQCRLDSYYNGATCTVDHTVELADNNPVPGTCNRPEGFTVGLRPLCWYAPR